MGNLANDLDDCRGDLSEPLDVLVSDVLSLPAFAEVKVVAGEAGLDRVVERANVMEVPDIISWVKPRELLLTTGYPLKDAPEGLGTLVRELDAAGVSALGVKLHRYLDDLPLDMIEAANSAGLPLLLLPEDAAFDDLLHEAFGAVVLRSSGAARADAMGRALMSVVLHGGGLDELMASLHDQLGATALVTTPDGRVLAAAGADPGLYADAELFAETERFRSERFPRGARRVGGRAVGVVPVLAGRTDHGRLVVVRDAVGDVPMTDDDLALMERAATVTALAITTSLAVRAVEAKYRGDFVRDVLTRRAGPVEDVVAHFATLGWDVSRPLVVVVAALDPAEGDHAAPTSRREAQERFAGAWTGVVSRADRAAPVVGFAQEVVAMVGVAPSESPRDEVEALVRAVTGDGGGGRRTFATGVSRVVDDPGALAAGYEQARRAVQVGRQLQGASAVAHFDDLGAFRLLSLIDDPAELDSFVAEVLGELARDDAEAADLRATLRVLLDTNLNVAETSRRLHFHYNTLRYRITKLERIVGPFATDPDLRLDLALALRMMQMRGL